MKCACCDKEINDKEIQWNPELMPRTGDKPGMFDYCLTCVEIAMEAAYTGEFDEHDEEEMFLLDPEFDEGYDAFIRNYKTYDEEYS